MAGGREVLLILFAIKTFLNYEYHFEEKKYFSLWIHLFENGSGQTSIEVNPITAV